MAFTGKLTLTVPNILQFLSQSENTGKLTLTKLGDSGMIFFKNGKIVYAAAQAVRNNLGKILVSQKHLSDDALMVALDLQHTSPRWERLGVILVEQGLITRDVLERAIQHQIKQVILEFLTWKFGFFRFDSMEINCEDGIVIDVKDFLIEARMDANHLLLEGLHWLDEQSATEQPTPGGAGVSFRFNFLPC